MQFDIQLTYKFGNIHFKNNQWLHWSPCELLARLNCYRNIKRDLLAYLDHRQKFIHYLTVIKNILSINSLLCIFSVCILSNFDNKRCLPSLKYI